MRLEPASKGTRFLNFLIDIIFFYIITFVAGIIWGTMLVLNSRENYQESRATDLGAGTIQLGLLLTSILIFIAYYTLMEGFTKGHTIGKYITGTKAINADGSNITFKQAFLRSIVRMVPFEPFSALGLEPWHDTWANTIVIKKRK